MIDFLKHAVIDGRENQELKFSVREVTVGVARDGIIPSEIDNDYYQKLRSFVSGFIASSAKNYPAPRSNAKVLDIAPQVHEGAQPFESAGYLRYTADIDPSTNPSFVMDITNKNKLIIPDESYDAVVCTEVLEHTLNPFKAFDEIYRILRRGAMLFASVPCNFRMHRPLPDAWRFTEHGIAALCAASHLHLVKLFALEDSERKLFPIDYCFIAQKLD